MTTEQHPITPPPELVQQWNQNAIGTHFRPYGYSDYIVYEGEVDYWQPLPKRPAHALPLPEVGE
jgi:hypothetical protein